MTNDLHAKLCAPFPPDEIEWRVGSTNSEKTKGLALAYLTARHVMDRLDAVVGTENWQDRYEFHGTRTVCYLSIRIKGEWVTKADGAGDSDVEAEKGSISDALKRAGVKWGIGRYLYDLGNVWVETETAGRSVKIKSDQYAKLQSVLVRQFGKPNAQPASLPPPTSPDEPDYVEESRAIAKMIGDAASLEALATLWKTARVQDFLKAAPEGLANSVTALKEERKHVLTPKKEAA